VGGNRKLYGFRPSLEAGQSFAKVWNGQAGKFALSFVCDEGSIDLLSENILQQPALAESIRLVMSTVKSHSALTGRR